MRFSIKLALFLTVLLLPLAAAAQDRLAQIKAGPYDDKQTRIVAAFIEPGEDSYQMQSMIVDFASLKNAGDEPAAVTVDLTSTVRRLATGAKEQQALQLRWKKSGELELRCEGKWLGKELDASVAPIVEAVKSLIRSAPVGAAQPVDVTLAPEVEDKVRAVLKALKTKNDWCPRPGR